jgi:hypothetical protein
MKAAVDPRGIHASAHAVSHDIIIAFVGICFSGDTFFWISVGVLTLVGR